MAENWVNFETCQLGGFEIARASRAELADAMVSDCFARRNSLDRCKPRLVFDANGHALSLRATDHTYRQSVDASDLVHADGGFLVTISKWWRQGIPERSATTDLIHDCAQRASDSGLSFYLLGGTEEVNIKCAAVLRERYPKLHIAGRRNGFFSPEEESKIIDEINSVSPDIVWIGLGKPLEQIFAAKWRDSISAAWVVTCGGCYNYITGDYKRAPEWMQSHNLEWLHRMATNPRKLLLRYLVTTPHALMLVLGMKSR